MMLMSLFVPADCRHRVEPRGSMASSPMPGIGATSPLIQRSAKDRFPIEPIPAGVANGGCGGEAVEKRILQRTAGQPPQSDCGRVCELIQALRPGSPAAA